MSSISSRTVKRVLIVMVIAAFTGVGAGMVVAAGSSEDASTDTSRPAIGGWPDDANGDQVISDSGDERIPALIRAVGDNGVEGYVRYEDLEGPEPTSPEEGVKMSGQERVIPVYAADGKTVLDQYTIRSGSGAARPSQAGS